MPNGGNILDELRQPGAGEPELIEHLVIDSSKKIDGDALGARPTNEPEGSAKKF